MFKGTLKRLTVLPVAMTITVAGLLTSCSPPPSTQPGGTGSTQTTSQSTSQTTSSQDPSSAPSQAPSSSTSTTDNAGGEKLVNVWMQAKPDNMSPLMGGSLSNAMVYAVTQDKLVVVDPEGKMIPRVATEWKMADDLKSATVKLADQKWSDGEPFTADDVVWSINAVVNPKVASPLAANYKPLVGHQDMQDGKITELPSVKKVDDRTVKLEFAEANAGALDLILNATWVLPKHSFKDVAPEKLVQSPLWTEPGKVAGLGPMIMTANVIGQRAEFKKNPNFRTPAKIDKLIEVLVPEDVALQQLGSGELDLTLVGAADVKTATDMKNVKTLTVNSPGFDRYAFNLYSGDKFKNAKVRQGIITAIDRAGILSSIYNGQAVPQNSTFVAPQVDYSPLKKYEFDTEKAKQLLKEGGWKPEDKLVIVQNPGNPLRELVHQVVLDNLKKAGIKAEIAISDGAATKRMFDEGTWDMFMFGGGNYLSSPLSNAPMVMCEQGPNVGKFCDPKLDALFTKAATTADETARKAIYQEMAVLDNEDVPYMWVGRPTRLFAHTERLSGVKGGDSVADTLQLSIHEWDVKK